MATTDVLQFFREIEPAFKNESDDDLIEFIGATQKDFLDEDPEFKQAYQDTLKSRMGSAPIATVVAPVAESGELALKGAFKGALDVFASVPKSIALGASAIDKLRGKDTPPEEFVTYQLGEIVREAAEDKFPIDDQARDTWSSKIGQGLGSAAGFLAGGAASRAAGAGLTGIAALGSSATSNEFYEDAKRSGADEDTAFRAAALGAGVGLTELIPLNRLLNRIPGSQAVGFKKTILDAVISGAEEAAQENLQSALQNVTAQQLGYDPDRGVFEGFEDATAVGGATGGILSLLASGLGRVRGPRRSVAPEVEQPSTTPQTDEAIQESAPQEFVEEAERINQAEVERDIPEAPTAPAEEAAPIPQVVEEVPTPEVQTPETTPEVLEKTVSEESVESLPDTDPSKVELASMDQESKKLSQELDSLTNDRKVWESIWEGEPLENLPPSVVQQGESIVDKSAKIRTKLQELQAAQEKLVEAQLTAREAQAQQQQDNAVPFVDENLEIETDVRPEGQSLITLGAVDPLFQSSFELGSEGKVEFTGTRMARLGRKLRSKLRGGPAKDVATEAEIKARSALQNLKTQGQGLANALENRLAIVFKGVAPDKRNLAPINRILHNASLLGTTRLEGFAKDLFAHKGESYQLTKADLTEARSVLEVIAKARRLMDYLARQQVDIGMFDQSIADVFSENQGFYVTRSYKVFSKAFGWNWDTVPSDVKEKAIAYIQENQDVTEEEATDAARDLLEDSEQTFDWMMGTSPAKGVASRLLRGRKEIAPEIRNLLGEIKDPVANIYTTIAKQADLVIGFQVQNRVASDLLAMGLASTEKNRSRGFTKKLFDVDPISKKLNAKRYPSLQPLYTTPELANELNDFYRSAQLPKTLQSIFKSVRLLTGIGKYAQVILSPKAYSTQFIAAIMNEAANGRLGLSLGLLGKGVSGKAANVPLHKLNAKAVSILLKNKKRREKGEQLTTLEERDAFLGMKGSAFLKNFKSILETRPVLLEDLAVEFGALGDQIDVRLLEDTILAQREVDYLKQLDAKRALKELNIRVSPEQLKRFKKALLKKGFKALPTFYGGMDQAGKFNAFLVESVNEAWANPDSTLEDILKRAGRVTESTTPNPSRIPTRLREASNFGLLNTYVSWFIELIRNRFNQADIATTYLKSENPRVRKLGQRKLSALLIVSAAIAGGAKEGIEQMFQFSGDNDDDFDYEKSRIIRRWLLPPWDQDQSTAIVRFDDKGFSYNNTSYILQDTALFTPVVAFTQGKPWNDALEDSLKSAVSLFAGNAPFAQAVAEAVLNYDADLGRKIVGEYHPASTRIWEKLTHIYKNAFQDGISRLIFNQAPKILDGSEGGHGRQYSVEEEIMSMLGVRNYGYNWEGAIRGKMQDFNFKYQEINREVSDRTIQALRTKGDPVSLAEAERLELQEKNLLKKVEDEYAIFFRDMLNLGKVTEKQLDSYHRNLFPSATKKRGGGRMAAPLVDASKTVR